MEKFNFKKEPDTKDRVLEKKVNDNEKFSKEEALFAQEYATQKEGKEYSEQATEENYEEAKIMLNKLKEQNIDWLQIDWDKVNWDNKDSINDLEIKLNSAAQIILESEEKKSKIKSSFIKKYKNIALPLAVSIGIIMGCENMSAEDFSKKQNDKIEEIEKEVLTGKIEMIDSSEREISSWERRVAERAIKEQGLNDEISKIEFYNLRSEENYKQGVFSEATLKITANDGTVTEVKGEWTLDDYGDDFIDYIPIILERGIKKIFKKDVNLCYHTDFQMLINQNAAIRSAINNYKWKKEYDKK